MRWSPLLCGCFTTGGTEYTFNVGVSEDTSVYEKIVSFPVDPGSWFLGESGGRVFFGQEDRVGNRLGWGHPIALDKSKRRLQYSLLYTAPKGTPLPSEEALKGLQGQIDADLERLGEEAMKARRAIRNPVAIDLPDFQKPVDAATPWDKAALASHSRKPIPTIVIGSDGAQRVLDTPVAEKASFIQRLSTGNADSKKNAPAADKKTVFRNGAIVTIGAALLLHGAITTWRVMHPSPPGNGGSAVSSEVSSAESKSKDDNKPHAGWSILEMAAGGGLMLLGLFGGRGRGL